MRTPLRTGIPHLVERQVERFPMPVCVQVNQHAIVLDDHDSLGALR
jgi:hypothetical protein